MDSEYKALQLEEHQSDSDRLFIEQVKNDLVAPLVAELEEQVGGFAGMDFVTRFAHAVKLNEPYSGKGDALPLFRVLVYSGVRLGGEHERSINGVSYKLYEPRFWGDDNSDGFFTNWDDGFSTETTLERFLTKERDTYDSLPVSYKAALLCRYIGSHVLTQSKEDIARFVLGDSDTLETTRFSMSPVSHAGYLAAMGWDIRIRDFKPDKLFWDKLRAVVCNGGRVPHGKQKKRRKSDVKTDTACRYIYDLERNGVVIDARKGGIGWAKVAADLILRFGDSVRAYEPDNLSRVYRDWKKRNEL